MSAKKHPCINVLVSVLFSLSLIFIGFFGVEAPVYAADPTVVGSEETDEVKLSLLLISGDPKSADSTVEYRLQLTNKSSSARSFESVASNLNGYTSCKWRDAQPNVMQECYSAGNQNKLTHVVTAEEAAQDNGFVPYITFRMYSGTQYQGTAKNVGGINSQLAPSNAKLTIMNPKEPGEKWFVGEKIEYKASIRNDTGTARSMSVKSSNLENYSGCKWSSVAADNKWKECTFAYHVVSEADKNAGTFTASIVWQSYPSMGYSGTPADYATAASEALSIGSDYLKLTKFSQTADSVKETYRVGDSITFDVSFQKIGSTPMSVALSTDTAFTNVSDEPAHSCVVASLADENSTHHCQVSYTLKESDLQRGEVEAKLALTGSLNGVPEHTVKARAYVYTQQSWDRADPAQAKDADPAAPAREPREITTLSASNSDARIRIPAIAVAPNGDLLASYDYRPRAGQAGGGDSPNENSIIQRRSKDNGKTWEPETIVARGLVKDNLTSPLGYSDPSYVVDHDTGTIFNFHVHSQISGVFANNPAYTFKDDGTLDEANEHTMNLGVSVSTDNGYSWEQKVITAQALGDKAKELKSCFATSGAGTQKLAAPIKGRLLQQMACVKKSGGIFAYTIYSDDHGQTWQSGNATPAVAKKNYDENKVVELSDGSLLLMSRSQNGGGRLVCTSDDSGENWKDCKILNGLSDENNNAQVIRAFPNAKPGTARSKVLLFSGTPSGRSNGTVWVSFDDGKTWPVSKKFRQGGTGYTTMAVQPDGSIGMLMESKVYDDIAYTNFNLRWIEDDFRTELKGTDVSGKGTIGEEFSTSLADLFQRNDPALADTFTVEGLPSGLTVDPATGKVSGTPVGSLTENKAYPLKVTLTEAEDGTGYPRTASAVYTLTLSPRSDDNPAPDPMIGTVADQKVQVGEAIAPITLSVKNGAISSVSGLPEGITYDAATGIISGIPSAAGDYVVTINAVNVDGEEKVSATFAIKVESAVPPADPSDSRNPRGNSVQKAATPQGSAIRDTVAHTGITGVVKLIVVAVVSAAGGAVLLRRRRSELDI